MQAKLGDIVATRVEVPTASDTTRHVATVWGRVISIDRFNPFFPAEAAQELADQSIDLIDTVLSGSRDHLEAQVLILGTTFDADGQAELSPLTYPVKPSAAVLYPDADAVRQLLTGERTADKEKERKNPKLRIGSLIGRADVPVSLSAKQVVSRHLAILAMIGLNARISNSEFAHPNSDVFTNLLRLRVFIRSAAPQCHIVEQGSG